MSQSFYPVKLYFSHWPNIILISLSLLVNMAVWVWWIWQLGKQPDLIFLHYNILFGVDYVGEWWRVLYLPIGGLLILIINAMIGWMLFSKDKFFAYIANATALFCQIFLLIAVSLLIFLNV